MAYDRYDRDPREDRWSNDRNDDRSRERGRGEERGFFERAGDEISSWFGASSDRDHRSDRGRDYDRGYGRDYDRDRESMRRRDYRSDGERDRHEERGPFASGGSSERDYNPSWREELSSRERERGRDRDRGYRPMAGDYGRGADRSRDDERRSSYERSQSPWGRDEYRRTSYAGSAERGAPRDPARGSNVDPHYDSWRERHMSDLDRDYDDYRRENHSRFESDFAGWRERRSEKRGLLDRLRPHMEVVGNDGKHVGTVDKIAGDRLILAKSDPESGGRHHSLNCTDIDRIEGDCVILDCAADRARDRWRDEDRSRALFERHDQGEAGPRILDRSFDGTYHR
jgi:hypothetical protein